MSMMSAKDEYSLTNWTIFPAGVMNKKFGKHGSLRFAIELVKTSYYTGTIEFVSRIRHI